jgi:glycerol-3-phosphate dehydrogenase
MATPGATRHRSLAGLPDQIFDLVVVGGGINGVGIARDAAGRGLSVVLCERGDLGSGTSSRTSKLVHGGLRYLEYGQLRLVRESLQERDILLRTAKHLVRPLRIVLPVASGIRSSARLRAGLWLYDALAGRRCLAPHSRLDLASRPEGAPLRTSCAAAYAYSDAATDDARLVVACALDAARHGAHVLTRTEFVRASPDGAHWRVELGSGGGNPSTVTARAIANVAGPWVAAVAGRIAGAPAARGVRLVKGSHLVIRRFWDGDHGYLVQHEDRRVIFVLPHGPGLALVGTTDRAYRGDPADVAIDAEEIDYLLGALARAFDLPPGAPDVVHAYAGVRPLRDDGAADPSAVSRDYEIAYEQSPSGAPLLTVYGGKLTTHRRLAERAVRGLAPRLGGTRGDWTAASALPGADFQEPDPEALARGLMARYGWLPADLAGRYAGAYGSRAHALLAGASGPGDMGESFGSGLYGREVDWLCDAEWARTADDILWRRTRLGLVMPTGQRDAVARWIARADERRPDWRENAVVDR